MSSVGLSIAVVYVVLAGVLTLVFVDIYTESSDEINASSVYQSEIALAWFIINNITVFGLGVAEVLKLKLRRRRLRTCYHISTLILSEISVCSSITMLVLAYSLPEFRKYSWFIPLDALWILPVPIHSAMNSFNHLILIFHSIRGTRVRSLSLIVKLRALLAAIYTICLYAIIQIFISRILHFFFVVESLVIMIMVSAFLLVAASACVILGQWRDEGIVQSKLVAFIEHIHYSYSFKYFIGILTISLITLVIQFIYLRPKTEDKVKHPKNALTEKYGPLVPMITFFYLTSFVRDFCIKMRIDPGTRAQRENPLAIAA